MCYVFSIPLRCTPIKVRHSCARKWNFFPHMPQASNRAVWVVLLIIRCFLTKESAETHHRALLFCTSWLLIRPLCQMAIITPEVLAVWLGNGIRGHHQRNIRGAVWLHSSSNSKLEGCRPGHLAIQKEGIIVLWSQPCRLVHTEES